MFDNYKPTLGTRGNTYGPFLVIFEISPHTSWGHGGHLQGQPDQIMTFSELKSILTHFNRRLTAKN